MTPRLLPKVALVHPYIWWGGSESCALWAVEALKKDYDVTLITGGRVQLEEKNSHYGTEIRPGEIAVVVVPFPRVFRNIGRFFALRDYRLARYCRRNADRYDVMFSIYNPMDFGTKGIQYILDPNFTSKWLNLCAGNPPGVKGAFYRDSLLRKLYLGLADRLSGRTAEGIRKNRTVADSDWTARATHEVLGIAAATLYPPVPWDYPHQDWSGREDGFVCLGRINFEKRLEDIVAVLATVRAKGRNIHLHVLGAVGDRKYLRTLGPILDKNVDWVFLEGKVTNRRKAELLSSHKYGIHGRANEPFGIAVAEMVKAGCVVWVPAGGGQTEIVGHEGLIYSGRDDAVAKIEQVMENGEAQADLREHLGKRAEMFSADRYMSEIRALVSSFLGSRMPERDGSGED